MAPSAISHQWHVRCLTVPGHDTDLSLHVAFDNVRFLFGCGEGTQRAFVQKRVGMRGMSAVFICSGGSEGRGGLPGLIMTACDSNIPKLDIVGPADIEHHLATLRSSVNRGAMRIDTHPMPIDSSPDHVEEVYRCPSLTVRAMALRADPWSSIVRPSVPNDSTEANGFLLPGPADLSRDHLRSWHDNILSAMFQHPETHPEPGGHAPGFIRLTRPDHRYQLPLPDPDETETDMVYICQAPPVPGKFDNAKASALKVPNGPIRRQLVQGETIEFEDEDAEGGRRIIRPEDVIGSSALGGVLIVVTCSIANLPVLLASKAFHPYQQLPHRAEFTQTVRVHLVVHRVPTKVWIDKGYQEWMKAFGSDTQHLIARSDQYPNDIAFTSTSWNTLHLSLVDDEMFPLPFRTPTDTTQAQFPTNAEFLQPYHHVRMQPAAKGSILPRAAKDIPYPSTDGDVQIAKRRLEDTLPDYVTACSKARRSVRADPRWTSEQKETGDDILVTTLGTGSAMPSNHRNVSSTHLDIPDLGGILLDAGEGTLGQLRRGFGPEGVAQLYGKLRMIFISHMHADHHLGLQSVLEDRFRHGITSTLYIVAPFPIALSLQESAAWQHGVSQAALDSIIWIDNRRTQARAFLAGQDDSDESQDEILGPWETRPRTPPNDKLPVGQDFESGVRRWPSRDHFGSSPLVEWENQRKLERLVADLGLRNIRTPLVNHRGIAWGLVIEHSSGWKIAYSGDTKPSNRFIRAGQGATLLIHEATLEDDKAETAAEKGHSTFSQAIEVGRRMNARHTLLNHFSQRYPKLARSSSHHVTSDPGKSVVCLSFDLMSVRVGDMWRMSHYMDAIDILFAGEEEDEGDDVTRAMERDANPTVDAGTSGGGASQKPDKREASMARRQAKGEKPPAKAGIEEVNEHQNMSPTKRECSPTSTVPGSKKVKGRTDVREQGRDGVLI